MKYMQENLRLTCVHFMRTEPLKKISILALTFSLFAFFFVQTTQAQQIGNTEKIKAAYVFNFIKYVEWPNDSNIKNFNIGFYGSDAVYLNSLKQMNGLKIRTFKLNVISISSVENTDNLHLIILNQQQSTQVDRIAELLENKPILLISEEATNKKNIMLNFVRTADNKIIFELNRYKMLNAALKVSPDILVLGGTELDIAAVLKEMNQTLNKSLKEIELQSKNLQELELEVKSREKQLKQQKDELVAQSQQLKLQNKNLVENNIKFSDLQNNYQQLNKELTQSQQELRGNTENLDKLKGKILEKENSILSLEQQINERKQALTTLQDQQTVQEEQLALKERELSRQLGEIAQQSTVIRTQYNVLIFAAVGSFTIFVMLIVIYRSRQSNLRANQKLQINIEALAQANEQLSAAQSQLVESEKMAALGGLVAGVAHEINTPIGVSVTATSHLSEQINSFNKEYKNGELRRSSLENLLITTKESTEMLMRNLERASELIRNFKQVAVDQSSEEKREFELKSYLGELCQSLHPKLKQGNHQITISAERLINLNSYPGVIAQIVSNLIINSVQHGFKEKKQGEIKIELSLNNHLVTIDYQDNGIGLTDQHREKVFEPFYTTARSMGGSGLGMSISYNLVTSKLNGSFGCLKSSLGAHFQIKFPL